MKQLSKLICPNCDSQLDQETAPASEGYIGFQDWKALSCPCCTFLIQNDFKPHTGWAELEAIAIEQGATRRYD